MPYPWFRVYNSIIYDPKLRRLTMPQRWLWVGLLAISSGSPTRGALEVCDGLPYTARDLALALCATPRQIEEALRQFLALGMIEVREAASGPLIAIAHWAAYQYEASSVRAQKHRRAKAHAAAGDSPTEDTDDADDSPDADEEGADDGDARADPEGAAAVAPCSPAPGECGPRNASATLAPRGPHVARNAPATPDADTESESDSDPDADVDFPSEEREGTILPSLALSPAREAPDPRDRAAPGDDDDGPPVEEEGAMEADDEDPGDDATEDAGEGEDEGDGEPPPQRPARHSWLVEDAIATCARKWAPGDDPQVYVRQAFKLWKKTDLDEECMVRAVKKAVAVLEVRLEKKLIHTGAYMSYLLEVLRREVWPETRAQRGAQERPRRC